MGQVSQARFESGQLSQVRVSQLITNDNLISNIPKTGKRVVINFDDPIVYEDLIENYLKKENNTFSDNPWDEIEDSRPPPTKEELKLYSDITKRVMDKLLELETKTKMM